MGGMHATVWAQRAVNNSVVIGSLIYFMWVPEMELGSLALWDKCLYPLNHLAGPICFSLFFFFFFGIPFISL